MHFEGRCQDVFGIDACKAIDARKRGGTNARRFRAGLRQDVFGVFARKRGRYPADAAQSGAFLPLRSLEAASQVMLDMLFSRFERCSTVTFELECSCSIFAPARLCFF